MNFPEDKAKAIEADLANIKLEAVLVVKSEVDNQNAAVFLGKVKARYKRLEDLRKEFTAPMNEAVKKINARFKMYTEPLEELETKVKDAMVVFMRAEQEKAQAEFARQQAEQRAQEEAIAKAEAESRRKQEEAERAAAEATNKKARAEAEKLAQKQKEEQEKLEAKRQSLVPVEVEAPKQTVRTESGTVTAKKVWTFKVINPASIQRQWLILDEKAVRKAIGEGTREIQGLEIYQDFDISSRQV